MTIELTVAELADVTEPDLGASPWRRVEQRRVDTFADATDDHQWIHVDPERAARGPFGGTMAHGCRVALRIEIRGQERPAMVGESIYLTYAG